MGKSETGAQNQTAAPAENSGAGPQTAGRNLTVCLLLFHFSVRVKFVKSVFVCFFFNLQVYSRPSRVATAGSLFKGESQADSSSLKTLYDSFRQTVEDMTTQVLFSHSRYFCIYFKTYTILRREP